LFRRIFTGSLVAVAAAVVLVSIPSAAHANPDPGTGGSGCYVKGCDGIDPASTSCANDANTIDRARVNMGNYYLTAELRYSAKCGAVWARTSQAIFIFVERQSPYRVETAHGANAVNWSRMVGAKGYWTRVCLQVPYGGTICSYWNGLSA
jgi:hypothetical protein